MARRARLRFFLAMLMATIANVACTNAQTAVAAVPAGWVQDCPQSAFCFLRPATLAVQPGQVIDSLAAVYVGGGVTLRFDLGLSGTSVAHLINPVETAMTINQRPARMLVTEHEIVLIVPKVHERGRFVTQFYMSLEFKGMASREMAMKVFQSIEFKPPR